MEDLFLSKLQNYYFEKLKSNDQSFDPHKAIEENIETPVIFHFKSLPNHIETKCSGHYYLRDAFIEIIQNQNNLKTLSEYIKKQQDKKLDVKKYNPFFQRECCSLEQSLSHLTKELFDELKVLLKDYNILFDFDIYYLNPINVSPVNALSKKKWEIEKKYICYWLDKSAKSGTKKPLQYFFKGRMDVVIPWSTDGERIAFLYSSIIR